MTVIQSGNPLSYLGVKAPFPPNIISLTSAPTTTTQANLGDIGIVAGSASYQLISVSGSTYTWVQLGGTSGAITSVSGTANQITASTVGNAVTLSLPSAITAPGSLTTTTTLASTTTMTAGTGLTVTTGGATITAGDATLTAGNVIINGAAKQLRVHGGAVTDFVGQATLVNGTVTVANTNIAATDRVFLQRSAVNASSALGELKCVISAATNFVVTACKPADATTETGDASTVDYFIVRQV